MRRLLLVAACLAASLAEAATVRVLVAAGSSSGDATDEPLRYAATDAERVRSVMVEIGMVSSDRAYLLADPTAEELRRTLREVAGRLAEIQAGGNDAMLIIYVSSHAALGELHLNGTHLPISELRSFAERAPARLRLTVLDACESGMVARRKGGVQVPEYAVDLSANPLQGQVFISSSGAGEPSHESDTLGGSLFTHHLLTGLRGDADASQDGDVTLAEVYAYAYRRTVSAPSAVTQHPALDVDLAGAGEVVLTRPAGASTAIELPAPLAGHYVVLSQPRPDVVAEVYKLAGRPLRLAVPAGHYVVRKTLGDKLGVATLDLPFGGVAVVDDRKLVAQEPALARQKGWVELSPNAISASGAYRTQQVEGTGGRWEAALGFRRVIDPGWVGVTVGFGNATFDAVQLRVNEWSFNVGLAGGLRWVLTAASLYAGAAVEATVLAQRYTRAREREIAPIYGALPEAQALGVAVGPTLGVEVPIAWRLVGVAEARLVARYLPVSEQPAWSVGAQGRVGLAVRF